MFDAIVRADILQVERTRGVVALEHRRSVVRDEEREGRRDVERLAASVVQLLERDVPSITRQDPCASPSDMRCSGGICGAPWFASALITGQQLRLSVLPGGMYSGQRPSAPGSPSRTTRSAGCNGARRLYIVSVRSHSRSPMRSRVVLVLSARPETRRIAATTTVGKAMLWLARWVLLCALRNGRRGVWCCTAAA